jgi:curli biogenesis system outer membrane secretion channel CsgG
LRSTDTSIFELIRPKYLRFSIDDRTSKDYADSIFATILFTSELDMSQKLSLLKIASSSLLIATTLLTSLRIADISPATANQRATSIDAANPNLVSLNVSRAKRPRIAVMDFEFSTIGSDWAPWLQTNIKAVNEILVNKLVDGGHFAVIERTKLDQVLQEQNLGKTGRLDTSSAAKVGRVLGVQTIIIGSVTEFNIDKQSQGISLPMFGSVGGGKTTANVKINMRAIDTKTGEILYTAQGVGSSNHGSNAVQFRGVSFGNDGNNQEAKLLSAATADAVEQIATKINTNPSKVIDTDP